MNPIPGCDGYYATAQGAIVSMRSGLMNTIKPRWAEGYLVVTLKTGPKRSPRRKHPVHRLVNTAFNGPKPFPSAVTRHLSGDPSDNRPENLRWGTTKENAADAVRHGTAVGLRRGDAHIRTKLRFDVVKQIRQATVPQVVLAKQFGVSVCWIDRIQQNKVRVDA